MAWKIEYAPPGPVGAAFINSRGPIDIIKGPAGSGKTDASVVKGPKLATEYLPVCNDGWVRMKLACIRDTYRDFARTALDSWYRYFPVDCPWTIEHQGGQDRPIRHNLRWRAMRGASEIVIDLLMETGAIGDANVEQFVKGYQVTAGWLNECDMLDERVPGLMFQRTGRFPAISMIAPSELERVSRDGREQFRLMGLTPPPEGEPVLPRFVWGDMNPPGIDNWSYRYCVAPKTKMAGYNLFEQPSGLSPEAENRVGKPRSSYELEAVTQPAHLVRRYVHGDWGYALDGVPVYETFSQKRHVADQPLKPLPGLPIALGMDAGGSPAAVIVQFPPSGQMRVLQEVVSRPGTGPSRFAETLLEILLADYRGFPVGEAWSDPSSWYGADREAGELAWVEIVARALNVNIQPAPSNEPALRHDAVRWYLGEPIDANTERMVIDPRCEYLIGGFAAHYKLTKQASAGGTDKLAVVKNEYSHPHDGLQYVALGHRGRQGVIGDVSKLGRAANVVGLRQRQAAPASRGDFDIWRS